MENPTDMGSSMLRMGLDDHKDAINVCVAWTKRGFFTADEGNHLLDRCQSSVRSRMARTVGGRTTVKTTGLRERFILTRRPMHGATA
jgi:hypothetical protein